MESMQLDDAVPAKINRAAFIRSCASAVSVSTLRRVQYFVKRAFRGSWSGKAGAGRTSSDKTYGSQGRSCELPI
eukprot:1141640-Pelagomonas_calceolata.AAC.5